MLCTLLCVIVIESNGIPDDSSHATQTTTINSESIVSPLSQYLVGPSSGQVSMPNKSLPKARLLTSELCLTQLKKKEEDKRKAAEEKERRKLEREEKRKERLQKLEEKKKQREENLKKKAVEKQKKADKKAKRGMGRNHSRKRPAAVDETPVSKRPPLPVELLQEESADQNLEQSSSGVTVSSNPNDGRLSNDQEDVIDPNTCCMCFVSFEEDVLAGDGAVWIPCPCGRWLHEDCAEGCLLDKDHRERYCPICIDILSVHA